MITKENVKDIYPLSPLQEGMLHHATVAADALAYCDQIWFDIDGPLDRRRFEAAWEALVERHDILRTAFLHEKTKRPVQVVLKHRPIPVTFEKIPVGETPDGYIVRRKREERAVGYDLGADPLMRVIVIEYSPDHHTVLWNLHHIMMDGWGLSILQQEFAHIYVTGNVTGLAATVPYARYIEWIDRQNGDSHRAYWGERLAGFDAPTQVPAPKRGGEGPYDLRTIPACIPADVVAKAEKTAANLQVTMGVFLQTVWGVAVANFHHVSDVVFGTVVSGRPATLPGADRMLGLFINAVPVRVDLAGSFADAAIRLQAAAVAAEPHHYLFLGEVQNQSPLKGRLIDHLFVYENYPAVASAKGSFGELTLKNAGSHVRTNYDFVAVANPANGGEMPLSFHYNAFFFEDSAIADLADRFTTVFSAAANAPDTECNNLEIIPANQRNKAINLLIGATVELPNLTVIDLIRGQAASHPDAVAVLDEEGIMSYANLVVEADQMSRRVLAAGVAPGDPVAVIFPRSRKLVVAALGVMGAGACYLPLDPAWPHERIAGIVEESRCRVVVTEGDAPEHMTVLNFSVAPPPVSLPSLTPFSAAYVIYTSGSTGRPKGVVIGHRALVNLAQWHGRFYGLGTSTVTTMFSAPSFDASIWEMISALVAGGRLTPVPDTTRADPEKMISFIVARGVTHTFLPPILTEGMLAEHEDLLPESLTIHTGGEALRFAGTGRVDLANNYGPSECCVVATATRLNCDSLRRSIPIGRPIDNVRIYLLDCGGRPVPIGGKGEIVIGGAGVGEGYLNRPDLTAERFAPDQFVPGGRIFKTGDLGRIDAEGNIFFAGRLDEQVQVRGYRVEPMEVERRLLETPGVTACAVASVDDNLTAFYVAGDPIDDFLFRKDLARTLPDYMIPAQFVRVGVIPTNVSGKIDRKALAPLAPSRPVVVYESPIGERETAIAAAWEAVLGKERVGRGDNFFALGGHSLKATQVASRLRKDLGVEVDPSLLLRYPTVAALAMAIEEQKGETGSVIRRASRVARSKGAEK